MGNYKKIIIGKKHFEGTVDITDPCYDKDVWCRTNAEVVSGEYTCAVWLDHISTSFHDEKVEFDQVAVIGIYFGGVVPNWKQMELIGEIGVDAGLAGFFTDKQDFSDQEWREFCDYLDKEKADAYLSDKYRGFFSSSGGGDGSYPVFGRKDKKTGKYTALEIRFD